MGFEPTRREVPPSDFQDRPVQPLRHLSSQYPIEHTVILVFSLACQAGPDLRNPGP
ncbi:hypothetical protein MPNT_130011 [Candidatus Methylacidithermus pantelleriae]|uniref:Uncharacterized protein n=1 Tax=Candidatus Methylacidithermus pantelleriae TaxID=2744239 RepID=A0A8J2FVF2_9BACT|nr:hypothetical protein MPNT_130011 [Candidatus Methylacidithermus pantelleriae]